MQGILNSKAKKQSNNSYLWIVGSWDMENPENIAFWNQNVSQNIKSSWWAVAVIDSIAIVVNQRV